METQDKARIGGVFDVECRRLRDPETGKRFRDAKGRFLPRQLVWHEKPKNIVPNEALNHMLDVTLHGKTLISPFYCVLSESNTTPLATHTYAVPGYTETTSYDEATRPEYVEAAASSQSITNSANKATFTISATKTIYGAALVGGSSTKSDTTSAATHVLFASSLFGSSRGVLDNDVINLTYTCNAADDA